MLPNHPDYITTIYALIKLRAIWIPVNVHLRGPSLKYVLLHAEPVAMIVDTRYHDVIAQLDADVLPPVQIWRGFDRTPGNEGTHLFTDVVAHPSDEPPRASARPDDILCISYTSGTTGEPKGVMVTDKMLRCCAMGAILGGDIRDGDVLFVWEPLYHIAGIEIVILALLRRVTIALSERFSASRFWDDVRRVGATHIHYVGGILQILLKQPTRNDDSQNSVRVAWGGGSTPEAWVEFERRFGVQIRELYGLTEASSISTINVEGRVGSIGRAAPYFEIRLVDELGIDVPLGSLGEIVIRERERGLLMPGYFRNSEESMRALRGGELFTGDLGRMDEDGFLYYSGRKKDSVRRRGENISSWEVERIVNEHPDVELSALIGVPSDIGDMDLKIFVKRVDGRQPDPEQLINWCETAMPYFQVPRYVAYVADFELTPTQRIRKESLSRATDDCWDRERARTDNSTSKTRSTSLNVGNKEEK
ncbi:MAG TPA: AMP-binding protein, partial [Nitrolancea sp.]|nr:AMP-binding protein [Nitrolancea sp.]